MKTRIKELRKSKRMSQTALAIEIGTSQNVISKIELEHMVPNGEILCKIADLFHTSVDYVLYRTDQRYTYTSISTNKNNARIHEYILKLQMLPLQEQDSILFVIDKFVQTEEVRSFNAANCNM